MTGAPSRPVRQAVLKALSTITERDVSSITDDTELVALGLDSLDVTTVLLLVEDLLGSNLPLEALAQAAEASESMVVADLIRVLTTADDST